MTKNLRPLASITADIYKSERQNVFTIGKLLREAKAHFPYGKWLPYLKSIDWSERTAQLYMSVVELADKYATVADLGAAPTALYQLTWIAEKHPDAVPLAIARLGKSAERKDTAAQQKQAVLLSIYALQAEDAGHKDTTELALQAASDAINQNCFGIPERMEAMRAQFEAIIKANPKTHKELKAVIDAYPIPPDAIGAGDKDEEGGPDTEPEMIYSRQASYIASLTSACETLKQLSAKPSATFLTSELSADELDMLGNFLKQIATSKRKADPIVTPKALSQPAATTTPPATQSAL